jgi:hypothetical protein
VRQLLKLIQKQGLSPVLKDKYERANKQWSHMVAHINALRAEAKQMQLFISSEADVQRYVRDIRSVLLTGGNACAAKFAAALRAVHRTVC